MTVIERQTIAAARQARMARIEQQIKDWQTAHPRTSNLKPQTSSYTLLSASERAAVVAAENAKSSNKICSSCS